jgi:hypothetical protein
MNEYTNSRLKSELPIWLVFVEGPFPARIY